MGEPSYAPAKLRACSRSGPRIYFAPLWMRVQRTPVRDAALSRTRSSTRQLFLSLPPCFSPSPPQPRPKGATTTVSGAATRMHLATHTRPAFCSRWQGHRQTTPPARRPCTCPMAPGRCPRRPATRPAARPQCLPRRRRPQATSLAGRAPITAMAPCRPRRAPHRRTRTRTRTRTRSRCARTTPSSPRRSRRKPPRPCRQSAASASRKTRWGSQLLEAPLSPSLLLPLWRPRLVLTPRHTISPLRPQNAVCIPCGHISMCTDCGDQIMASTKRCPICRTTLTSVFRVYNV